ncbi:hypothetical protein GAYE_SCF16G3655 [Galdieria yellowstonensis]|uniref:CS domain-containing protein n=1 Tax=Galdieria yellowstonensis TaxID=3028027 RepID=A0AAV9IEV8_9RHOD|nr:hypothetical protein GAYE_SCF16G3655 [Galdieria yellowstonensis]
MSCTVDTSNYEWSQTNHTITIIIQVPYTTSSRDISLSVQDASQVKVTVASRVVFLERLWDKVCTTSEDWIPWQLEETEKGKFLVVELEKEKQGWWNQLVLTPLDEEKKDGSLEHWTSCMPADKQEEPPPTLSTTKDDASDEEEIKVFLQTLQSRKDKVDENSVDIGRQIGVEDVMGVPVTPDNVHQVLESYRFQVEEKKSGIAAFHLGRLYHFGICVEKDYKEALRWYQKALELGCYPLETLLVFNLGLLYSEGGYGIEQNLEQAVQLWQVGADQGNPYAMYNLGVLYLHGSGCEQDITRAMLLLKAANSLDPSLVLPDMSAFSQVKDTKPRRKKLSEEEKQRVYAEFRKFAKYCAWTGVGLCAIGITWKLVRHYLNNRL